MEIEEVVVLTQEEEEEEEGVECTCAMLPLADHHFKFDLVFSCRKSVSKKTYY